MYLSTTTCLEEIPTVVGGGVCGSIQQKLTKNYFPSNGRVQFLSLRYFLKIRAFTNAHLNLSLQIKARVAAAALK